MFLAIITLTYTKLLFKLTIPSTIVRWGRRIITQEASLCLRWRTTIVAITARLLLLMLEEVLIVISGLIAVGLNTEMCIFHLRLLRRIHHYFDDD